MQNLELQTNSPSPLGISSSLIDGGRLLTGGRGEETSLSLLTGLAGFASVAPRLRALLEEFACSEDNVVDKLKDNVSRLQDAFIDALYSALEGERAEISRQKLTLRLDKKNRLKASTDHPDIEAIDRILDAAPELSLAFAEIAAQSAVLRDISSLHSVVMNNAELDAGQNGLIVGIDNCVYQISLKGEMNHFYFSRP